MWNAIIKWLGENYPSLVIYLIIIVAVWAIASFYYRYKKMEDKVEKLPCDRHADSFKDIDIKLTKIITILTTKYPSSAAAFSIKQSPRRLNPVGEKLLVECGGKDFLEENKTHFLEMISRSNPKTALDVEAQAYEVLLADQNMDIFNKIKQWVYNSPTWDLEINGNKEAYSITMGDICFVLSIPLRDMFLAEHPEVPTEE